MPVDMLPARRPRRPVRSGAPANVPRRQRRSARPWVSPAAEALLELWAQHLLTHTDRSEKTRKEYLSDVRQFLAWWEQGADLVGTGRAAAPRVFSPELVTTSALATYRAYMLDDLELAWKSVNRALTSLKRFYAWAVATWAPGQQLRIVDPAAEVRLVRSGAQPLPRQVTSDEVDLLVAAARRYDDRQAEVIIRVLATAGLRATEMCNLGRSAYHPGTRWEPPNLALRGKGNKDRIVPIPEDMARLLESHMTALPASQKHLWTNQYRQPLTYSNLHALLEKYSELAGINPPVRPHDLRHFYGYTHAARGTDLKNLMTYMGHDDINTTAIYTKGRAADRKADAERLSWR